MKKLRRLIIQKKQIQNNNTVGWQNMRVYELAKQKKISSKEMVTLLRKAGVEVASHMSVLPDGAIEKLKLAAKKALASTKKKPIITRQSVASAKKVPTSATSTSDSASTSTIKKTFKPKSTPQTRKTSSRLRFKKTFTRHSEPKVVTEVILKKDLPLFEAAQLFARPVGDLILALLKQGKAYSRNHLLSVETISSLANQFGIVAHIDNSQEDELPASMTLDVKKTKHDETRWPIVVVMGHVDHGKTTLLDYIRKMNTAAKEKGGITQHLSAYEVDNVHGKITFLDTPGHEAFTYMRKRGASVTDIAILVVAADDGIMPQTIEAIKHSKAAGVPIIVAINKIDKEGALAQVEKIKRQLAQQDLLPEDWGGDTICVPVSAISGQGVEELLEMISLQAQMMELKADPSADAKAFVLESHLDKGLGPVAIVIPLNGTLKVGDSFICGSSPGKVRLLINSCGERVSQAGPSIPVQVVGFDSFVALGDWLTVVSPQVYLQEKAGLKKGMRSNDIVSAMSDTQAENSIPLIIKADTQGSKEAVLGTIAKVNKAHPEIPSSFQVIFSGVGTVAERDVDLAAQAGAQIIALHVKSEKKAVIDAQERNVSILDFNIIYKMSELLEEQLKEHEEIKIVLKKVGEATVLKVFDLKSKGVIAGCYVNDGIFGRGNIVRCIRKSEVIGEGKIASLQRERKVVKEVHKGHECGFITDSFHGWQVDDIVHCFIEEEKKASEI